MCTRAYHTYTAEELYFRYLTRRPPQIPKVDPNYNLAPTHETPIVRIQDGERVIETMRFGLVPPWEPEFKTKLSTLNARAETVFTSRLYRTPVRKRRCLVPLSGFIEWKAGTKPKQPFKFSLKDEPILSIAGFWEPWHPGSPDERRSFTIITTEPNELSAKVHNRMPVLIDRKDEERWLDPGVEDPNQLSLLLKPFPAELMKSEEISTLVNSPANNGPEVLEVKKPGYMRPGP